MDSIYIESDKRPAAHQNSATNGNFAGGSAGFGANTTISVSEPKLLNESNIEETPKNKYFDFSKATFNPSVLPKLTDGSIIDEIPKSKGKQKIPLKSFSVDDLQNGERFFAFSHHFLPESTKLKEARFISNKAENVLQRSERVLKNNSLLNNAGVDRRSLNLDNVTNLHSFPTSNNSEELADRLKRVSQSTRSREISEDRGQFGQSTERITSFADFRANIWPVLFAAAPAVLSLIFGTVKVSGEFMVLISLMYLLYHTIRVPWSLYLRTLPPMHKNAKRMKSILSDETINFDSDKESNESHERGRNSESELKRWRFVYFTLNLVSPFVGAIMIAFARTQLTHFKDFVSNYTIILFIGAACYRPLKLIIKKADDRAVKLQESIAESETKVELVERVDTMSLEIENLKDKLKILNESTLGFIKRDELEPLIYNQVSRSIRQLEKKESKPVGVISERMTDFESRLKTLEQNNESLADKCSQSMTSRRTSLMDEQPRIILDARISHSPTAPTPVADPPKESMLNWVFTLVLNSIVWFRHTVIWMLNTTRRIFVKSTALPFSILKLFLSLLQNAFCFQYLYGRKHE
ncbi:hypothetical protein HK098_003749 [Nowakowskiella sp. JEL0407]|nr:hypothetical protein HK098_003749 [Nowakowskiella sp. JEL0407]